MRSFSEFIEVFTKERVEIVNITPRVRDIVLRSGIKEGICLVFPHHTSSAVYVSDSDSNLTEDLKTILNQICPKGKGYAHDLVDYKMNAEAHLRSILTGHHITLPITEGRLHFGIYQTIYYAEFDGQREKEVLVKVIGE